VISEAVQALTAEQRAAFLDLVERQFGIRGSDYGAARMDEAVSTVLPTTTCTTPDELLASLETDSQTRCMHALVQHLTVGETYFLRDPAQIAALRETILPDLVGRRASERRLRLWSAGCSTGEEPYTLAILLREQDISPAWDVLLVGTDVNRESLRVAREGHYAAWSLRATPDEIRNRYFLASDTGWRLNDSIRRMTRFAWMNLGADALMPPSADLDLIMCRNVTIYFDEVATQRLYRALVRALAPGGWLMLGPSDPVPADRASLDRVEVEGAVLWRRVRSAARSTRGQEYSGQQGSTRVGGGAEGAKRVATPRPRANSAAKAEALPVAVERAEESVGDGRAELHAGLLALEAGALAAALDWLRRAAFRDPRSPLAQFALACAYVDNGDRSRAQTALVQARRLLAPLDGEALVPGSDALPVETLRQTIRTHLEGLRV
jgi:chemotaxis protein methyltransferase CheR